jgi:hypothetical protein
MAERERMRRPAPLSELFSAVFRGTPAETRLREGAIWQVWPAAVGKQIAGRARPVAIRDGILTVAVTSAPWMQQLTFLKKGIIEKLNTSLGEDLVRDIQLKAGRPESPPVPKEAKPAKRSLTAAERQLVAEQAATVTDPELREAFANLMAQHLKNTKTTK